MSTSTPKKKARFFERFAMSVSKATGTTSAFITAFVLVLIWGATGPLFHYSDGWQMIINTGTTIITFLMVFLIQKAQNKDSLAIQLKLNELVAAHENASNRLVNVEDMTEDELKIIQKYYSKISEFTKKEESLRQSHSIDEMHQDHNFKEEMEAELEQEQIMHPEKQD
jgi:low affinity Fe/Cu permease